MNECSCETGRPNVGITVLDNGDCTHTINQSILNGLGNPEVDGLIKITIKDKHLNVIFKGDYKAIDNAQTPTNNNISIQPYFTGSVGNGQSFVFRSFAFASDFNLKDNILICLEFEHPKCGKSKATAKSNITVGLVVDGYVITDREIRAKNPVPFVCPPGGDGMAVELLRAGVFAYYMPGQQFPAGSLSLDFTNCVFTVTPDFATYGVDINEIIGINKICLSD